MQNGYEAIYGCAKHCPRLWSHLSYPHYQDHRLLPPSPKPISDEALGFGGEEAEGIKSYYFSFVIYLLSRGLSAFLSLCVFFLTYEVTRSMML